jgi:hypothetical protein
MTLRDIVDELGIPSAPEGHHHCTTGWVSIDCPFCSPGSNSWRLGISESYGSCNCWICGTHRLYETLANASGRPIPEIAPLCEGFRGDRPVNAKLGPLNRLAIPSGLGKLLSPHQRYLRDRNLDPDELETVWGIGGFGIHSRFPWRIFIPIRMGEDTVSWTTRAIVDKGTRYITAKPTEERISSREVLYGAELARNGVVVVEGPTSAWSIGPGAVATLGIGHSQAQVLLLSSYSVRVVCFDAESQAQKRARKLCRVLKGFDGETFNVVLSSKDPNVALSTKRGRREIRELRSRFLTA